MLRFKGLVSNPLEFGDAMQNEFRLKQITALSMCEVAKEKDRTIQKMEELNFLTISIDGLLYNQAFLINNKNNK